MAWDIPSSNTVGNGFLQGVDTGSSILQRLFQNKLHAAQTEREKKMADLPFGGANVPGAAGHIVGLEMIKGLYGKESPQYLQALEAFNLQQKSNQSRINYQEKLADTLPIRYTTPEGRQIIEQSNVNQGYSPAGTPQGQPVAGGQVPYQAPSSQTETTPEGEHYGLRQIKSDVPASVLQKNLYANNIDKTTSSINLDALTSYNGPKGAIQLKQDEASDAMGKAPERYQQYKQAEKLLGFLISQVRQFYGDSIQPQAMELLSKKLDPRGLFMSSDTGKKSFNSVMEVLGKELQTYRDAAKSADTYTGNSTPEPTQTINTKKSPITFSRDKNGKIVRNG